MLFSKGSKIYNMVTGKCPKCHIDSMYVNNNPYAIAQTMTMHENCRKCGFKYKVEPNFFFGAMYVSYGLAVMAGIAIYLVSRYVFNANLTQSFVSIFVGLIAMMPIVARFSRNIYINLFVNYDPKSIKA